MFCAAVPVVGAVGAKLNAEQMRQSKAVEGEKAPEKPIKVVTTAMIGLLLVGSFVYHTNFFGR
jgi:TRAP-type mannitol/chloroaromatic compound transport system permease large subunit